MRKELVRGEQLRGNLFGVDLDRLAECLGTHLAPLDFGERSLPIARQLHVGDTHILDYRVECQSLFGRHERLFLSYHILSRKERFDNRRAGRRRADTARFKRLTHFVVFYLAACRLHRCQQRRLRVQRFGLGLALGHRTAADKKRHALRPFGQYGILRLLAVDAAPARLTDDRPFGDVLHTVAYDRDGRHVLDTSFGEGFEHTPDDHVVYGLFVG